jgi:hypothetical protein
VTQLSFFGAEESPSVAADLAGLLAGPGQVVVRGGAARLSVVVGEDWRVAALRAGLAALGLDAEPSVTERGATAVRTAFSPVLLPLARAWQRGADKRAPDGLVLTPRQLRWWCLSAGRGHPLGYLLRLGPSDDAVWDTVGAALARAGVPGTFLGVRADGPAYRITGRRRLLRLRELVGDPPPGVPAEQWPKPGPRGP